MTKTKPAKLIENTGYRDCACRDCFQIAIGAPDALCHECQDAGCEGGDCECLVEPYLEEDEV